MKKQITKCPVCKKSLVKTANNSINMCPKQEYYVKFLDENIEYSHAIVYQDNGTSITSIDIPPYSFNLIESESLKQTRICKMSDSHSYGEYVHKPRAKIGDYSINKETLLVLPRVINCNWNDIKEVEKMVKTFMLFS